MVSSSSSDANLRMGMSLGTAVQSNQSNIFPFFFCVMIVPKPSCLDSPTWPYGVPLYDGVGIDPSPNLASSPPFGHLIQTHSVILEELKINPQTNKIMAGNRVQGQLIFQTENLDIRLKGAAVDGRTRSLKTATKKGGGGLGSRKALNDITNSSSLHQEVSSRKKKHLKEDFNIAEEMFLHDHKKCIDARKTATERYLFETGPLRHDLVSLLTSPKPKRAEAGFDSPPRHLEPVDELPMSEFSAWLESPIQWDSPPPSPPFPWRFEPVEFVLKPENVA
ncbi:hypothetical protein HHK36_011708 [Tetracentron sinense]|uniref:Uncharacterized protein n=1 Tax=Tetracentron sinense TaxID=13715 RepID=A0A834Z9X5_TETSI|nr:hypothetical protein HHK36_011708 [Tetracentron sinense]